MNGGANFFYKLGANWLAPFVRGQLRAFGGARHAILKYQIGLNERTEFFLRARHAILKCQIELNKRIVDFHFESTCTVLSAKHALSYFLRFSSFRGILIFMLLGSARLSHSAVVCVFCFLSHS